ncbi:hypothetical protein EJB05_39588, partial [Eragrostis curvula]
MFRAFLRSPTSFIKDAAARPDEANSLPNFLVQPKQLHSFSSRLPAMILVVVLAELLQEYAAKVARALEPLLNDAPLPRRMRFFFLQSLLSMPPALPSPQGYGVTTEG